MGRATAPATRDNVLSYHELPHQVRQWGRRARPVVLGRSALGRREQSAARRPSAKQATDKKLH